VIYAAEWALSDYLKTAIQATEVTENTEKCGT